MASNRHSPAVEEGELPGSPTMPQPIIPTLAPQPLIPATRPHPTIPASRTQRVITTSRMQPTIPTPTAQPAPEQLAGTIQRSFPAPPVRKPFLWGILEKILGQWAFGTVYLVHQTRDHELWGARKVGAIPLSFEIPDAHDRSILNSLPIWKDYELLKRACDDPQPNVVAAIDQGLIHFPHEARNTVVEDCPVIDETATLISITMEYAPNGDLRFFMEERPRM